MNNNNKLSSSNQLYGLLAGGFELPRFGLRFALTLMLCCWAILGFGANQARAVTVSVSPPVSTVLGNDTVKPAKNGCSTASSQGCYFSIDTSNFKPYRLPGQEEDPQGDPCKPTDPNAKNYDPGDPFFLAYTNPTAQPIQTSDWWTSLGLQKQGWVLARGKQLFSCLPDSATLANSLNFYSEPFQFHFDDFNPSWVTLKGVTAEHGLTIWNSNTATIINNASTVVNDKTKYNTNNDTVTWGPVSPSEQAVVTIGLDGVHPLREDEFPNSYPPSGQAPTNIRVQQYSDWGVVASYTDKSATNQLNITMANGSPFVWLEKTKGTAEFDAWVGGMPTQNPAEKNPAGFGSYTELMNSGGLLVVSVTTYYGVPGATAPSTALYAIYADKGTWTPTISNTQNPFPTMQLYQNKLAAAVVVTAIPHNVTPGNFATAWNTIKPFACRKTVGTQLNYPPNKASTTVNGATVALGYDQAKATVTGELQVFTQPIATFPGCTAGPPLQLIFPHHRKVLLAAQQTNIAQALVWNTLLGPAFGYSANTMVMQMPVKGLAPLLPGFAIDSTTITNPTNSTQTAAEDIYDTLKTWFYRQEPVKPGQICDNTGCHPQPINLGSFATNADTYSPPGANSYLNATTTPRELVTIADQLAQSTNPKLNMVDAELGKTKKEVAAEIRDGLLQSLKEMIGAWFDIYSSQLFQYNTTFNSLYGYPAGFGAVKSFNDHHFHYGYFLRSFAAIARYDKSWIGPYQKGALNDLINDVANFDRTSKRFPVLREFNPFYGHSWANGAAYNGNDEESTSEAINFEVGMIELGDLLGNANLRNLGIYLYEQEILATEQYWFNQDAKLNDVPSNAGDPCPAGAPFFEAASTPPVCYNGNWPRSFVTYKRATDGSTQRHTLITRLINSNLDRTTHFDSNPIAAYTIEAIPVGPSMAYLGRNQNWLKATWNQFISDSNFYQMNFGLDLSVYQNVMAGMQTLLPASGTDVDGTGRDAALMRVHRLHPYFPPAMNTTGKYLAYTLGAFGQVDNNWVANRTEAEAFTSGANTTFVSYNPTGSAIAVTFTNLATKKTAGPFTVKPFAVMASGTNTSQFIPTTFTPETGRLYLHADGTMDGTVGTKVPPNVITSFPVDNSAISQTLTSVPIRSDGKNLAFPPPPAGIVVWKGTFSGTLVGSATSTCKQLAPTGPLVCDPAPPPPPRLAPYRRSRALHSIPINACLLDGRTAATRIAPEIPFQSVSPITSTRANAIRSRVWVNHATRIGKSFMGTCRCSTAIPSAFITGAPSTSCPE